MEKPRCRRDRADFLIQFFTFLFSSDTKWHVQLLITTQAEDFYLVQASIRDVHGK